MNWVFAMENKKMRTISFSANIGVVAGYGHQNQNEETPADIVGKVWQGIAAEYFRANGVYVGAVIADAKTVYHKDWGCPGGGENTALVTGTCNPHFTDTTAYKAAVTEVLHLVARQLGQSTTQLTFSEVEFEYFDLRDSEK
ncbi:MAG: hypothetical protein RL150_688 [Candidatus Parcubacteria bacterium]|jgi:hypothetical protein